MIDIEKFEKLTNQIDTMIASMISPQSEEFIEWKTKTERVLERLYGEQSKEYKDFKNRPFWSLVYTTYSDIEAENRECCCEALKTTRAKFKVYIDELKEEKDLQTFMNTEAKTDYTKVFVVHGHDGELKEKIARLLEKQNIEPIILSEQPNQGRTVIEKLEAYAAPVAAAICLFTADDDIADGTKRARQNVVFETGYFYGNIGRKNTVVIADEDVMNLSDLKGIIYVNRENWEVDVLKELRAIGYHIDFNRL